MLSPLAKSSQPTPGAANDLIKDVGLTTFMADVIEASQTQPVIVDFWAPWCGPCKQLTPILEKLVQSHKGAVRLAKVDIDQNQEIAQQMQVQSIPAVFAFFQGRPVDGFMGVQPESQVKSWIDHLVKSTGATSEEGVTIDSALKQAAAFLETNQVDEAQSVFTEIMQMDPANATAYAGIMRCLMERNEIDQAKDLLAHAPPEIAAHKALDSVKATLELADQAGQAVDHAALAELAAKVQQNPADHQTRFDLAMAHYAANDREAAVDALLEIIRRQRSWNDEAARKQLVKFFEAFGMTDPLTVSARRRLSSILFA